MLLHLQQAEGTAFWGLPLVSTAVNLWSGFRHDDDGLKMNVEGPRERDSGRQHSSAECTQMHLLRHPAALVIDWAVPAHARLSCQTKNS